MSEAALTPAVESTLMTTPAPPTSEAPKPEDTAEPKAEEPKAEPLTLESLKVPEGATLDKEAAEGFLALANESGLQGEAAQKLFDYGSSLLAKAQEAGVKAFQETNEKWADGCKQDKEFGGDKLEGTLANIAKLLDNPKFTDPELRTALLLTGAGNHPAVFRTFAKLAALAAEGTQVSGEPPKASLPTTFGEALYGKEPKG